MRHPMLSALSLSTTIAIALTAACAGYQPAATTGYQQMVLNGARSVLPGGFTPNLVRPSWMKSPPGGAGGRIAVAQFGGSSVLWFLLNDKKNTPPSLCQQASSTNGTA